MADKATVEAVCENGHTQRITLEGYTPEQAKVFAVLLDGTSPVYLAPPAEDERSVIGKCGICKRPFKAKVVEEAP